MGRIKDLTKTATSIDNTDYLALDSADNGTQKMLANYFAKTNNIATCSTASATSAKEVTLSDFELLTGVIIQVTFDNANTASVPTLNVNSTGAKAIYNEEGTAVSATNPAYFPAGATVEFIYNGTYWVYKNRIVESYVNGTEWYRIYSDGWIEQGGAIAASTSSVSLLVTMKTTSYSVLFAFTHSIEGQFYAIYLSAWNKTTSGFTTYSAVSGWTRSWVACGY